MKNSMMEINLISSIIYLLFQFYPHIPSHGNFKTGVFVLYEACLSRQKKSIESQINVNMFIVIIGSVQVLC